MIDTSEGYVKYTAEHTNAPAVEVPWWAELNETRTRLHQLGLVGANSKGIGFGNVSVRYRGDSFLISGTSTGAPPVLQAEHYCLVKSFDITANSVITAGPVRASSEAMTHGAVYRSCPEANCVIHIHSREIFDGMIRDKYPATPESAAFGTPEIALALIQCVQVLAKEEGRIVLAGHDEGVISYGPSVESALALIKELFNKYSG
jgi:ribulose-5-phosphate 4-epimerase/fuculose-1-phosphate aldolase